MLQNYNRSLKQKLRSTKLTRFLEIKYAENLKTSFKP